MSKSGYDHLPEWLVKRLSEAPDRPGCYLMVDQSGRIVYIGKARSLRKRLQQYFRPSSGDTRFFVGLLDSVLSRIDLIVSTNDKEAILLEDALIKKHQPTFNVRLKDDKSFLHIRLDRRVTWPRLEIVRRPQREDAVDLFGPYASASALRQTMDVLGRHFQLRTCTDSEFRGRRRPCLEHQIGRCPAPCTKKIDASAYDRNVQQARAFLSGRGRQLMTSLEEAMKRAAVEMRFERASTLRDRMKAIEKSLTPQSIAFSSRESMDAIGLYREGAQGSIDVLRVREGVLADVLSFPEATQELPSSEWVRGFLTAYYANHDVPRTVLIPVEFDDREHLGEFLGERCERRVQLTCPQRGEKRRLMDLACANAKETTRATFGEGVASGKLLAGLRKALALERLPRRIECYDISNIQGTEPVASMVVAIDGELATKAYRRYKIQSGDTPDDYRMMREVLGRRLKRGLREGNLPDLILLDGGRGQLGIGLRVLEELDISGVELASLAKERSEDEDGHIARGSKNRPSSRGIDHRPDRVFRPARKNPILLPSNSNELFLLQRLRDEAHRFAVTFHKKLRRDRTLTSKLLRIDGLGKARLKTLLKHFGSVKAIEAASLVQLQACPGVGKELGGKILRFFSEPNTLEKG